MKLKNVNLSYKKQKSRFNRFKLFKVQKQGKKLSKLRFNNIWQVLNLLFKFGMNIVWFIEAHMKRLIIIFAINGGEGY